MKAYNGVATLTRKAPDKVIYGLHEGKDNEDFRIVQTVVDGIPIINTYVPQGFSISSEKYALKLAWFRQLRDYFEHHLDPKKPAIWTGDVNVAPEPIDVYHPDRRVTDPDFHIDARNTYKETVAWGFVDVYRKLHPDVVQYTYWDYYHRLRSCASCTLTPSRAALLAKESDNSKLQPSGPCRPRKAELLACFVGTRLRLWNRCPKFRARSHREAIARRGA
jgi:exodeoxyribonuclease III